LIEVGLFSKSKRMMNQGSVLTRDDIKRELLKGSIKIWPFKKELLREASYDVRLGEDFMTQDTEVGREYRTLNIWGESGDYDYGAKDLWNHYPSKLETINIRGKKKAVKTILIEPKEMVLGHTEEFVGTDETISVFLSTRSSIARSCFFTCQCSFFGNPNFFDRWTLEITNNTCIYRIPLVAGEPVSSMIFVKTSAYKDENNNNSKQELPSDEELEAILNSPEYVEKHFAKVIKEWNPEKMKSKLSKPQ